MKRVIKGRGAADNPANRFEAFVRERETMGEGQCDESSPRTVITLRQARSIISRNDSPDVPFSQSINPYQGCEHGCVYCFARPSHAYLGAGATTGGYVMLRLPLELKDVFKAWLEAHFPLRAKHVMARVRDTRGGRENDPEFGSRIVNQGEYAEIISRRFNARAAAPG